MIIRYCCGKQCEVLSNRFLIKDLNHKLNLLCHLPLSSIIDEKIRPLTSFSPPRRKKFQPPTSSLNPHLQKISTLHLHFDNSITVYNIYYILLVKDLPMVPGVAARMGLEPTTFRSKGIESTNVPPRPTNINR